MTSTSIRGKSVRHHWGALFVFLVSAIVIGVISQKVMLNFPNSADEYSYIFQARNLARGQVYAQVHPPGPDGFALQQYFSLVHIGENEGKYYGRFPFGYSLLLVPAVWAETLYGLDILWMVNTIFGGLTVLIIFSFSWRVFDAKTAYIAAIMAIFSPWLLFTSASFFAHTTNAFFIAFCLLAFCVSLSERHPDRQVSWMVLAGCAFGLSTLVRFLDPLAYIMPLMVIYLLWLRKSGELSRQRFVRDIFFFCLGGLAWGVVLLIYNVLLTGDPFTTAYSFYNPWDQGTRFIFNVVQNGESHFDFTRIIDIGYKEHTVRNVALLFEWHPWVWCLAVIPFALRSQRHSYSRWAILIGFLMMPLSVVVLYMLYGGPAMNQYGPRYYYSFFMPITVSAAFAIRYAVRLPQFSYGVLAVSIVVLSPGFGSKLRDVHKGIYERSNLYRTIKKAELKNSVVFLTSGSGSMPVVDLCRNNVDFDDEVLIAQSLGGNYGPLIRAYPRRTFYEYSYETHRDVGELRRLQVESNGTFYRPVPEIDAKRILRGVNGLVGYYFEDEKFSSLRMVRLDRSINFDLGFDAPDVDFPFDHFSVRWEGFIQIDKPGLHQFSAISDDGVRLRIDGYPVIEKWYGGHLEAEGSIDLKVGFHRIEIEYFDSAYESKLGLFMTAPGQSKRLVEGDILRVEWPTEEMQR